MPSYVVAAAGESNSQQIHQLNQQIQQLVQNHKVLEDQLQQLNHQIPQLAERFQQMIVDTGSVISTLQNRLASLEAGAADRVVLFELKERVAQFEGEKEKEKNESRTRRKIRLTPSLPTTIPEQERGYHAATASSAPQN